MANIKSAKKRILVNQTKALQNKMFRSQLKTDIKKYYAALRRDMVSSFGSVFEELSSVNEVK